MTYIKQLEPTLLWENFEKINQIPRGSKNEKEISNFLKKFGEDLGLETYQDEVLNIIIKKKATQGLEHKETIVLQAHMDMVHQKSVESTIDFIKDGISMYIDGDWVKAKDTTLGADNGIGLAAILAILASNNIPHPAIEALITVDEETGMTGAFALKPNLLKGKYLLNLDSEDDDEITIGCAGGIDFTATKTIVSQKLSINKSYLLSIQGLKGGHSGVDIHKKRANANLLLFKLLDNIIKTHPFYLQQFECINLRNVIARSANAIIGFEKKDNITPILQNYIDHFRTSYLEIEPNITINIKEVKTTQEGLNYKTTLAILKTINTQEYFHGVFNQDKVLENFVISSNNVASINYSNNTLRIACLIRSSVEKEKTTITQLFSERFKQQDFNCEVAGEYPGWEPNKESSLVTILQEIYINLFHKSPKITACHAGLECGIIGKQYPAMEMISFGPNIRNAHSPQEKVSITSTLKFWHFLLEILNKTPDKQPNR